MARFISIVNQNNFPVYFRTLSTDTLKYQSLAEMALDFVQEQRGLVLLHDGVAVYGQLTNTNLKLFIGTDAHGENGDLDQIFKQVHQAYIDYVCNPFYDEQKPEVTSKRLDKTVSGLLVE